MVWRHEFIPSALRDLDLIGRFIELNALARGESEESALTMSQLRIEKILTSAEALTRAPYQGTRLPGLGPSIRRTTKDRAIFYFDLIEDRHIIRILAIFFGGQDHDSRILARLLSPG